MKKKIEKKNYSWIECRSIAEAFDFSQFFNEEQIRKCREIKTKPSISP